jgi:hypothetical protein
MSISGLFQQSDEKPNYNLYVNSVVAQSALTTTQVNTQKIENGVNELPLVKPVAFDLNQEVTRFSAQVLNVTTTQQKVTTYTILNQGEVPYNPEFDVVNSEFLFTEPGVYAITLHILPISGFLTSDFVNVRFFDEANLTQTRYIEGVFNGSGAPANTAGFTLSGIFPQAISITNNFTLSFLMLGAPVGTPSFDISGVITRIK